MKNTEKNIDPPLDAQGRGHVIAASGVSGTATAAVPAGDTDPGGLGGVFHGFSGISWDF